MPTVISLTRPNTAARLIPQVHSCAEWDNSSIDCCNNLHYLLCTPEGQKGVLQQNVSCFSTPAVQQILITRQNAPFRSFCYPTDAAERYPDHGGCPTWAHLLLQSALQCRLGLLLLSVA